MSPKKPMANRAQQFARSGSQNSIHQAHQRRRTTTDGTARRRSQTGYRATATFASLPPRLRPSVSPPIQSQSTPPPLRWDARAPATAMGTTAKIFKLNPSFRARREAETDEAVRERERESLRRRRRRGESETVFRTVTNTLRSDSRGAA